MEEKTFEPGTIGRCNRCDAKFTFTKPVRAVRENTRCWRVMDMAMAECGHLDTHWIFDVDNQMEEQPC